MNSKSKSIGLLLGLVAILALGYLILGTGDDSSTTAIEPVGLGPELRASDSLTPDSGELSAAKTATTKDVKRQAVPKKVTEEEKLAAKAAEKEEKRAAGPFFTGTVFGSDGIPIPGAEVKVEGDLGGAGLVLGGALKISEEGTTDRRGEFRVPRGRWPLQELSVELRARGFNVIRELRSPDSSDGDGNLGDFVLKRGVVLAGTVIDADGKPVAEARVRRTSIDDDGALDGMIRMASTFGRGNDSQTKTDAEGRFELAHEEPGKYLLVVEHDDYPKLRQPGEAPVEGGEDLNITLRLAPTASIAGRILGFPAGRRGVSVQASIDNPGDEGTATFAKAISEMGMDANQSAQVKEDGTFEIKGLDVSRKYSIRATVQEGFFARTSCSETEEVLSGTSGLELTWDSGARVQFNVADEATGKPLRNLVVRHRWEDQTTGMMPGLAKKLEFDGSRVTIDELRPSPSPGTLEFSVHADGYLEKRVTGTQVPEMEKIDLGTIHLRVAPIVRVQVVDTSSGKPLSKARVVLRPQNESVDDELRNMNSEHSVGRTDRDGWCELAACSTELAILSVKKGGYAAFERPEVRMPTEGKSEEVVRLFTGGRIEIQVLDAEGIPAPEIRVVHRLPDESTKNHETSSKGIVSLSDLEAGEHSFRAERRSGRRGRRSGGNVQVSFNGAEGEHAWKTVILTNGAEAELEIELPPTATAEGLVLLRGQPVSQARVALAEGEDGSAADELSSRMSERMARLMPDRDTGSTRTDSQGRFELKDLPMGKHRIRVARDDGSPAYYAPVDLRAGKNRIEIDLPSSAVEGRITDADGKPIAGASVETLRATNGKEEEDELAQIEMAMSFFGSNDTSGVRTDYDGHYRIEGIPTGVPLVVRADASGYSRSQSEPFEVAERDIKRGVEVVLTGSGTIRVNVVDGGSRFQPVTCEWEGDDEKKPSPKMAILQNGSAIVRGLKPGKWKVFMSRERENFQIVEVHQGEQTLVDF